MATENAAGQTVTSLYAHFAIGAFGGAIAGLGPEVLNSLAGGLFSAQFHFPVDSMSKLALLSGFAIVIGSIIVILHYRTPTPPVNLFKTALIVPMLVASLIGSARNGVTSEAAKANLETINSNLQKTQQDRVPTLNSFKLGDAGSGEQGVWSAALAWIQPASAYAQASATAQSRALLPPEKCLIRDRGVLGKFESAVAPADQMRFAVIVDRVAQQAGAERRALTLSNAMNADLGVLSIDNQFAIVKCGNLLSEVQARSQIDALTHDFGTLGLHFALLPVT